MITLASHAANPNLGSFLFESLVLSFFFVFLFFNDAFSNMVMFDQAAILFILPFCLLSVYYWLSSSLLSIRRDLRLFYSCPIPSLGVVSTVIFLLPFYSFCSRSFATLEAFSVSQSLLCSTRPRIQINQQHIQHNRALSTTPILSTLSPTLWSHSFANFKYQQQTVFWCPLYKSVVPNLLHKHLFRLSHSQRSPTDRSRPVVTHTSSHFIPTFWRASIFVSSTNTLTTSHHRRLPGLSYGLLPVVITKLTSHVLNILLPSPFLSLNISSLLLLVVCWCSTLPKELWFSPLAIVWSFIVFTHLNCHSSISKDTHTHSQISPQDENRI